MAGMSAGPCFAADSWRNPFEERSMMQLARLVALVSLAALSPAGSMADSTGQPAMPVLHPAGPHLGLDEVLNRVLERNPTLGAARAARDAARARARAEATFEATTLDFMTAPRSYGSSNVDAAYRIGMSQALPISGQRGLQRRRAEAESDAAAWDLRTAQLDLVHDARVAYIEYWRTGRAIALNQELIGLMPQLRRVSLARYSSGIAGQHEPLAADAELATLDHQGVVLERERRVAAAELNVLMHEDAEAWLPPPPDTLAVPDTNVVHTDLAPRARALRSELAAAEARVRAGEADVALARRQGFPAASFGIAYDRFWSEPELRTSVSISMSVPIARLSAARAESRARLEATAYTRAEVRDRIDFQVASAAARLHEQAHDVQIARERMVPLAERALRAARASYEANRTDFANVLNVLRDYLQARLEADESLAMLHQARADLDRALGELPAALEKETSP
jgi:cobalt-zinc-cadmium efflux system outer membrane protein